MPLTQKERDLKRRQRRRKKIKELRTRLEETTNKREREKLITKIRKQNPWIELPEA